MRLAFVIGLAWIVGCGGTKTEPGAGSAASAPVSRPGPLECTPQPFAASSPVPEASGAACPEASGAAWLTIDGKLSLVVIGDSGNDGAYAIVDPETGETREQGELPLGDLPHDGGGDDLEGIAVRGGKLVAVTSPGWIRVWERVANGFALVEGPYPLGPVDLPDTGGEPPEGTGMVCAPRHANCGRNYEGLCLAPDPGTSRCIGFVASKADGHLYCVVDRAGKLAVEHAGAIRVMRPGVIGDCAFSDDGSLYVGGNLFDTTVHHVAGWQDPKTATVEPIGPLGLVNPETLAVRGELVYRMSDGLGPSLMMKYRCTR
jgi:hypothetical protein